MDIIFFSLKKKKPGEKGCPFREIPPFLKLEDSEDDKAYFKLFFVKFFYKSGE